MKSGGKFPAYCIRGGFLLALFGLAFSIYLADGWLRLRRDPQMELRPANVHAETLIVAMDNDYQPYSFPDARGAPAGFDVEFVYALAHKMGMNVEVRLMPWGEARRAVLEGRAHLLAGLERVPENTPEFELSVPLHNDPFIAFGRERLEGIEDLYGKRIALLGSSASYDSLLQLYGFGRELSFYNSYCEVFDSLIRGENDYAIARYSVGRRELAQKGASSFRIAVELPNNYLCLGVRGGEEALIRRVDAGIIALSRDGTKEYLSRKWLDQYVRVITWKDFVQAHATLLVAMGSGFVLLLAVVLMLGRFEAARIRQRAMERALEYQRLVAEATKGLYEGIYEMDITHNRAGNEDTRRYFESLGLLADAPYDEALRLFAQKQVREEDRQGYLDIFDRQRVLQAYAGGVRSLSYDCVICPDGKQRHWMRVSARIFFLHHDRSVRMLIFRQNIDEQKKKEQHLALQASQDSLTGLYNKAATERLVEGVLGALSIPSSSSNGENSGHAFFILDIDNFKSVNDTFGHAVGDAVIREFARELQRHFRDSDIVGRIGGDEFVACMAVPGREGAEAKARELSLALHRSVRLDNVVCHMSASIGVALAPEAGTDFKTLYRHADKALYATKQRGKNGYTIYEPQTPASEGPAA